MSFFLGEKSILRCLMDFSVVFFHYKGIRSFTRFIQSSTGVAALTSFSSFIKMYVYSPMFRPLVRPAVRPTLGLLVVSEEFSSNCILSDNISFFFQ
jgi:hypothetical protein